MLLFLTDHIRTVGASFLLHTVAVPQEEDSWIHSQVAEVINQRGEDIKISAAYEAINILPTSTEDYQLHYTVNLFPLLLHIVNRILTIWSNTLVAIVVENLAIGGRNALVYSLICQELALIHSSETLDLLVLIMSKLRFLMLLNSSKPILLDIRYT
jgi:hypothetical protein